jgi:hypothetical protein
MDIHLILQRLPLSIRDKPTRNAMINKALLLLSALPVLFVVGCGTTRFQYQEMGRPLEAMSAKQVKEGLSKTEVLGLLGNPYDTLFLDPSEEEEKNGVVIKEIMTYYHAAEEKRIPQIIWVNTKIERTTTLQRVDILLENGIVVRSQYIEEKR